MKRQTALKQTEIGMIPEDWEIKTLGEFISIKHGFAFKGEFFSDVPNENILLTPGNFHIGGGFKSDKFKYYTGSYPEEYTLRENDLIVTMTDLSKEGDTLGYSALIPKGNGNRFLHNQRLGLVILKSKSIDKAFLYWVLRTRNYHIFVVNTSSGSTVKHTAPTRIYDYKVALPKSVEEQQSIAKILSDLDSKIELSQQMNTTLEKVGQALFKHWFIDFEFPNEKGKPYRSSGGEMVDSELGEIPEGWQIKEINDCGKVVCGKTPSTQNKENYGDDIPFITIPDMRGNVFVVKTENQLSKLGAETQAKKELPSLAVCVSCIATPGLVSLTSIRSHTNQQINSIICNADISPYFMFYTMREKSEDIQTMGLGGTATLNLNTGDFSKIKILVPDKRLMEQFHTLMVPLFKQLLKKGTESLTLVDIRGSLLPRLMSGKIRVNFGGAS